MSILISVDGNIGSGKSSLLRFMKNNVHALCLGKYSNEYEILFLQEPVHEWMKIKDESGETILSLFYNDQTTYAFAFQMMAYISRLNELKNVMKSGKKYIIISERSVFTDKHVFAQMLYDDNLMKKVEFEIYNNWFDSFIGDVPLQGIVYLDVNASKCRERILKRDREGEDVDISYLQRCEQYHEQYVSKYNDKQVLRLDSNIDNETFDHFTKPISEYIYSVLEAESLSKK